MQESVPLSDTLRLADDRLLRDGRPFDPWTLCWADRPDAPPDAGSPVAPDEAVRHLFHRPGARRVPVAVIGPREASAAEVETAHALGRALAEHGLQLLCGGKSGVMEAVCRGALEAGGQPIGLLPDEEWSAANRFVAIPIATGIGPARNAIIGRAALVLIAVGGGYGTITEMAYGLHFDRLVLGLCGAPAVPGAVVCADVAEALERTCRRLLGLDSAASEECNKTIKRS